MNQQKECLCANGRIPVHSTGWYSGPENLLILYLLQRKKRMKLLTFLWPAGRGHGLDWCCACPAAGGRRSWHQQGGPCHGMPEAGGTRSLHAHALRRAAATAPSRPRHTGRHSQLLCRGLHPPPRLWPPAASWAAAAGRGRRGTLPPLTQTDHSGSAPPLLEGGDGPAAADDAGLARYVPRCRHYSTEERDPAFADAGRARCVPRRRTP